MSESYDPISIESAWQKRWEEADIYAVDLQTARNPFYHLVMFPYPSGAKLHVGHWFQYSIPDSYSRFVRMQGKDVFHPMGFDAFGLPAENYAIKTGTPPADSTQENIDTMIEQFKRMGVSYDWSHTLSTTDPEYYRWTQWLFLQMLKHDLAERRLANVNWCPKDQTVLAREQCQDGLCERCGSPVVQKPLTQWFWKITQYAQKLIDNLEQLDWPEKTKLMQRNWIGRSEGAEIEFAIDGHSETITVFTTRPDTLFGVTYLVLAPEHEVVERITHKYHWARVDAYRKSVANKTELQRTDLNKDKTGEWTGAYAVNPVNGEKVPIWIADYVLAGYGTGAVMAVPGHDERDYMFASSRREQLKIVQVIESLAEQYDPDACWVGSGTMVNSDFLNGLPNEEAKKKIIDWLEQKGKGRRVVQYRLKDWLVSRQRYWGAPIPIVYDPEGVPHPIPEEHLPWLLPTDVEFKPTGESPLKQSKELRDRVEKIFGKGWTPEYDTMDTFVCSSFYYLRFLAEHSKTELVHAQAEKTWMPVDLYIGGPEHACMHLIYARFVMLALKDMGHVTHDEPFVRLIHQGLITHGGSKMSKSKGNVVSPDAFVERYGSDVFRLYLMFMGPFSDGGDWNDTGINGVARFARRIHTLYAKKYGHLSETQPELKTKKSSKKIDQSMRHMTVKRVTHDMERLHFNTAISALMEWLNVLEGQENLSSEDLETFCLLLAPLAPHLAEELWSMMGKEPFVAQQSWPTYDESLLHAATQTVAVQVNGKVRGQMDIETGTDREKVLRMAKTLENVEKYLVGDIRKEIYIEGKMVSFVVDQSHTPA